MRQLISYGLLSILISCGQEKLSDIEVIKFDNKIIQELNAKSDTLYSKVVENYEIHSIDYYLNNQDSVVTKIFKDSSDNVIAITKSKKDELLYAAEYYPNGQLRGKLPPEKNGKLEGHGRYYFEDGRVWKEGEFKNGLSFGEWKIYNKDGQLILIEDYGEGNINPLKKIEVK